MSKRFLFLLVMAATTLLYWGCNLYVLRAPFAAILLNTGFSTSFRDSYLIVTSVMEKNLFGKPTLGFRAGLKEGDKILAIQDPAGASRNVKTIADYLSVIKKLRYGEPWGLTVERAAGENQNEIVPISIPALDRSEVSLGTRFLLILAGIILPLIAVATAFFIGFLKPEENHAILAGVLFLGFSTLFTSFCNFFPPGLMEFGIVYNATLNLFMIYLFMHFFLVFPSPSLLDRKMPWLKHVFLAGTTVLWVPSLVFGLSLHHSLKVYQKMNSCFSTIQPVFVVFTLAMVVIGLASLILNTFKAQSKDEKRRMTILLTGTVSALIPLVAYCFYVAYSKAPGPWWILALLFCALSLFPLSFIYVVIKHRVLGLPVILRRGVQYALVSRGFLVIEGFALFAVFFFITGPLLVKLIPHAGQSEVAVMAAAVTLCLLVGLREVNRRVLPFIDRRFFREAYDTRRILTELSHEVHERAAQPCQLLKMVNGKILDSFHPDQVVVFLRGSEIAHLPGNGRGKNHKGGRGTKNSAEGFQCYCHQWRPGIQREASDAMMIETCEGLILFPDGHTARVLAGAAQRTPEALEVFLDKPRSWVHPLAAARSADHPLYKERMLLERLNTRLLVPLVADSKLLGFISLGEKLSEEPYTSEDKELLLTVAEQTAVALDYAKLIREATEQEKLKRELEIAKEVQRNLFPQALPPIKTLEYTGMCKAARGVGGDYYDFLLLDTEKLAIALGDISGKGISAAFLIANLQAVLRSFAPMRGDRILELFADLNRMLCRSTDTNKFATLFYGVYDGLQRRLAYINAGHNPPLVVRAGRAGEASESPWPDSPCRVEKLDSGGTIPGIFPESSYQQGNIQLAPGNILVVYSDGITKAENEQEEEFTEERLTKLVLENRHRSAESLRDLIFSDVGEFLEENLQQDDMTLIVAKIL
jgi:sigma-B regulation protein RsbU (phosphoserine phosphatase)